MKQEWLNYIMRMQALFPSYRLVAYFLVEHLNWATMDCWPSHKVLSDHVGMCEKTIQRAISAMEQIGVLSAWRLQGSRHPFRYAPVYFRGKKQDTRVLSLGQRCPETMDARVHKSFLQNLPKSPLVNVPATEQRLLALYEPTSHRLSFKRSERGKLEPQIAQRLEGFDVLSRLAAINDEIITRLCEAHCRNELSERQIRAAQLAAKQSHTW